MRVIGGRYRRRQLKAPAWEGLRPTSDRLKQTLFDVLTARIPGARVLDGFAGSGALGLEALSRGAAEVVFVDHDARAIALVAANLAHCGVASGYVMIRDDFQRGVRQMPAGQRFDLILLDPPYETDVAGVLETAAGRLTVDGRLVLEHASRRPAPDRVGELTCLRRLVAGDSALAFYGQMPAESADTREGS
ncbi:MAG: 16S rRNA (guanine(966)-N(2))-methyltransferase RsmD [Acidobacteria bacterium]|nr:16S rRNA (guanine(966)-N(2))-methyltransferase RsmD [Acidobacteriota bacterium]